MHYVGYCDNENILNVIEQYVYVDDLLTLLPEHEEAVELLEKINAKLEA